MYTHPALAYVVITQQLEQASRAAEHRRFALEHADQLRPRSRRDRRTAASRTAVGAGSCETAAAC